MKESIKDQLEAKDLQNKLIQSQINQTFFTELVALASIIIGTTAVIGLFGLQIDQEITGCGMKIIQYFTHVILWVALIFLIIDTIRYAIKKYPIKK